METAVALRGYELEHSELPNSLVELAPAFLEHVPIDPFDGKPVRYNREHRRLHSVGADLADDGGHEKHDVMLPFAWESMPATRPKQASEVK